MPSKLTLLGAAILLAVSGLAAAHFRQQETPFPTTSALPSAGTVAYADGDLVFRAGRDMVAHMILSQGEDSRFSHVGLILKKGSTVYVVHAIPSEDEHSPGGVLVEPLSTFASPENAQDIGVSRVKGLDAATAKRIIEFALLQQGKAFDNDFLYSDDKQFYCSELVLKAYAAGGIDLTKNLTGISLMTLREPVFPPDQLRHLSSLSPIPD